MIAPMTLKESGYPLLAAALLPVVRAGDVLCLEGDLGAGKTALARQFIRTAAGGPLEVPSPTFTLVQTYETPLGFDIWHFDLYRLARADEVFELGWEEARARNVALVEWPACLGALLPADRLEIRLSPVAGDDSQRRVELVAHGNWVDRMAQFATLAQPHQT